MMSAAGKMETDNVEPSSPPEEKNSSNVQSSSHTVEEIKNVQPADIPTVEITADNNQPSTEPPEETSDDVKSSSPPPEENPTVQTSATSLENNASDVQSSVPATSTQDNSSENRTSSLLSTSGISSWAKALKMPQISAKTQGESQSESSAKSTFSRFTSGLSLPFTTNSAAERGPPAESTTGETGVLGSLTKGLVDSSRNAVKSVQVKARHMVSQNKRRYQEGGFDLDLTYITDNVIAMGFPAGDISSGIFGYVEGFYRNHMEEVIKFLETRHQGKYKVYNLCSERLYDASLFQGKAASCPFDDHNCPPIHLILSFCQSASKWLKEDVDNVVVVHCKAGLGRTGLMISSLLLFLQFCQTAEESVDHFNQKRCVDGKGLVLPSQIRYVKYFERLLKEYHANIPKGRRCMLRGFRLHKCPYWIRPSITISDQNGVLFTTKKHPRTKDLMPEDFWINSSRKGIVIFALPGEPGLTELVGDFKIHFHDRHGDFYCWFNTTMMDNRIIISSDDIDGFDKRKLPSPPFKVEIVMVDYDGTIEKKSITGKVNTESDSATSKNGNDGVQKNHVSTTEDKDDVFSDSDGEDGPSKTNQSSVDLATANMTSKTQQMSIGVGEPTQKKPADFQDTTCKSGSGVQTSKTVSSVTTDFKAIAADASVFSFGDEEDYDSE